MPYIKTEEKKEEGITIKPLSQKIIDNIDILNNILTPLEMSIIDILEQPRTVKEIRDYYIIELAEDLKLNLDKHKGIVQSDVYKKIGRGKFVQHPKYPHILLRKYESIPKTSKELEKELKKRKIKIPSYEKFDNILLSLEKLGITARRYDTLKKGKFLWILNPNFLIVRKQK